jgi:magnesium transporter
MDPEVPSFLGESTLAEVLERIRSLAESRRLFYLYVVDERGHLLGIVNLWQLVSSPPDRKLREILTPQVVTVRVDTPEDEVLRRLEHYGLLVIPVVDEDGKLAGVISVDDLLPVMDARSAQDLYRLANLSLEETVETPPLRSVRLRISWLLINLATAFLAAWVVSLFEATLAKYVVLASFMPIVAGMGGNAGTQTLTVVVRALAMRQLEGLTLTSLVLKQCFVGFANGVITGLVLALVSFAWEHNPILSLVLFIAETVNLTIAGLAGALVPVLLHRFRLDPALGSSIFVTTATDVGGFLSFLGTATLLLGLLVP